MPKKYSPDFKERAIRMVEDHQHAEDSSRTGALKHVGAALGVSYETIRNWAKQQDIDNGKQPGVTSEDAEELRRLRRENAELRRANEILKTASAFFAAEPGRPTTK